MNIKVDRNEFLKALITVSKATTLRNVGSLEGILLESYDDVLSLYATNKEIQISTIIDAKVIRAGKLLINSRILSDIVRSFDNGEIEINSDENNNIKLTCLNSKFNITAMDHRTFPNKEVYNINDFIKMDNHVIRNMIKETSFACANSDSVSPILTGILIENNDEDIKFVAIDGFRMAIRSEQSKERYMNNIKCVVPASTLNELNKILTNYEDDVFLNINDKKFIASVGRTQIISSLLQGQFIDYFNLLPKESKTIVKMNKNELLSACERASIISDEGRAHLITLHFNENNLLLTSKSAYGNVEENISINLSGESLDISFNSRYVIDALKVIEDEKVILEFNSSNSPCLIKPVNSNKFTYLIMPVRISN
ncbi:DNA polymerase III subunit beta [Anaerofustis sp.]|uniref:DNA polymerase III subunit beta n=1 Tax=Anaerofustis sp. TaxID=1872517 RepID=UPI0025BBF777|nr:DNA polymerase III subunit beta [Anaerofustis sp.]